MRMPARLLPLAAAACVSAAAQAATGIAYVSSEKDHAITMIDVNFTLAK